MDGPSDAPPVASLFAVTVRRSVVSGRVYLIVGIGYSLLIAFLLGRTGPAQAFGYVISLFLPVFAAVGGMGALQVFTNDRLKGVFEYLLAYGVSARRLFANSLGAALVLVTIVVATSLAVGLGEFYARRHAISQNVAVLLVVYSVPMSYATVAFSSTIGMFWTSFSSPREGMNSPIGLVPLFGVAPPVLTLVLLGIAQNASPFLVPLAAVLVVSAVVLGLVGSVDRLLRRERLLSPS